MGGLEFQDLLTGIDAVIERGLADGDRVGMGGWSYGGYLSALAATHHSHRFKAAMMGAGLSNWISFTGTTDIPEEMCTVHWNRPMAENFDVYWERSPLSGIANAQTPTLILHGAGDERVPPGQAHEMYQALKTKGVPVQLVLYPRSGHGVRERAHRIDLFTRELEWFEKYLK
jgi:dipeptidyl aminopeptidase/acylaminoacyl peptidase